jgi:hypothetical protein
MMCKSRECIFEEVEEFLLVDFSVVVYVDLGSEAHDFDIAGSALDLSLLREALDHFLNLLPIEVFAAILVISLEEKVDYLIDALNLFASGFSVGLVDLYIFFD